MWAKRILKRKQALKQVEFHFLFRFLNQASCDHIERVLHVDNDQVVMLIGVLCEDEVLRIGDLVYLHVAHGRLF